MWLIGKTESKGVVKEKKREQKEKKKNRERGSERGDNDMLMKSINDCEWRNEESLKTGDKIVQSFKL